jgi:exonuclease VII large subunit
MKPKVALLLACLSLCGCSRTAYNGQVSEIRQTKGGLVIDLDGTYPKQAMAVYIPRSAEYKFPSFPNVGDALVVKGKVSQYRGRPEIIVTSPAQFEK